MFQQRVGDCSVGMSLRRAETRLFQTLVHGAAGLVFGHERNRRLERGVRRDYFNVGDCGLGGGRGREAVAPRVGPDQLPKQSGLARSGGADEHHAGVSVLFRRQRDEFFPLVPGFDLADFDSVVESRDYDAVEPQSGVGPPVQAPPRPVGKQLVELRDEPVRFGIVPRAESAPHFQAVPAARVRSARMAECDAPPGSAGTSFRGGVCLRDHSFLPDARCSLLLHAITIQKG